MKDRLLFFYKQMQRIREFEEKAIELFEKGELPGFLHSCIGQEAVAVGVCSALNKDDYIYTTHRGHGHVIAKGMDMKKMFAELYAKETGSNRGKGGSMHMMDGKVGVLGANGVVGAGIPLAAGTALSQQMQGNEKVTVAFFGDGATNTGAFHEGLNLAAVWDLPVIFVCENNKFSESTPTSRNIRIESISERADSYGFPGIKVDGNRVEDVYKKASEAIDRAKSGQGPTLIEADTYRIYGHYIGDQVEYRDENEFKDWQLKDPIQNLENTLLTMVNEGELQKIREQLKSEISQEVESSLEYARNSPNANKDDVLKHIFS